MAERGAAAGGGYFATLWTGDVAATAVDLDAWLDNVDPAAGAVWTLEYATGIRAPV